MSERRRIYIGCSGWNYKHWRGRFYPEQLRQKDWFDFYAQVFDTVEINNTFYRLPSAVTFRAWHKQAPDGFIYAVKASRYITHLKKLKGAKQSLEQFLNRAILLEDHLGPVLYQLPPNWNLDIERLQSFLDLLPSGIDHVFEFRDQSWMVEAVFRLLDERGVSFCAHDFPGLDVPRRAVGPVAYVRFHGPEKRYRGSYADATLRGWWRWMQQQLEDEKRLYVYFNNDAGACAVRDALRLKQIAGPDRSS
ncbi:MAG TPA: DUF72 domain-containing protein [Blastocatellia bacterium]|nr:DUF72 domain-containing protein [Blastocatellia bacterium]